MLFSALLFGERAEAAYYRGSEILSLCESSDVMDRKECGHWLMGLIDALTVMKDWGYYEYACLPDGVVTSQLLKLVVKGLNEEPEELHLGAGSIAINVITEAFPCD